MSVPDYEFLGKMYGLSGASGNTFRLGLIVCSAMRSRFFTRVCVSERWVCRRMPSR